MGQKTCGSCHGTGGYYTTERIHNPAGGMFQTRQVRKSCPMCGGSGSVYAPDPPPSRPRRAAQQKSAQGTHGKITVGADGKLHTETTPEEADKSFAGLLGFAIACYIGYLAFFRDFQAETWVKWSVTLGSWVGSYWYFDKYRRVTRMLRKLTGLAILAFLAYWVIRLLSESGS